MTLNCLVCPRGEMADTTHLKCVAARRTGSNPVGGIMRNRMNINCPVEKLRVSMSANGLTIEEQIAEDTCEEHDVFCCPQCFDMSVPDDD